MYIQTLQYTGQHVHPMLAFYHVMQSLHMMVGFHNSKVGARTYTVPYTLDPYNQYRVPLGWLVRKVKDTRGGESAEKRMEREMRDILKKRSPLLQKKMDAYKQALDNRSYMHFRWLY